jgi:hypothetical protein
MSIYRYLCRVLYIGGKHAIWLALPFTSLLLFQPRASAAQAASSDALGKQEVIGRLAGDDVSVAGAISFENENGRTNALLASGSDLTLRSGQAKIDLSDGGEIILCGPAHLSILKSGSSLTIALDYGQLHLHVSATAQITVFTALLVVTPEAIGDRERDLTVGLDRNGELCITALFGAARVEEQLTGEKSIIPQGGDIQIDRGELKGLHSGSRKCSCELLVSQSNQQKQIELSVPAHPSPTSANVPRPPQPINAPTYRIDMPPLTFDASSPTPPPLPSPEAMLIIRESVADPQISFRGAVAPALPPPPAEIARRVAPRNSRSSFFAKIFGIFRHHKQPASEQGATLQPKPFWD